MDRLKRVQSMGLNAVQVYVPWNWHEMEEGVYDFHHGHKDLPRFLRMAQELGLMVLLRLGPYMCGEVSESLHDLDLMYTWPHQTFTYFQLGPPAVNCSGILVVSPGGCFMRRRRVPLS